MNGGQEFYNNQSNISVEYTLLDRSGASIYDAIDTTIWGDGNLCGDPCFVAPGYWETNGTVDDPSDDFFVEGDYHLKSQAGRWDSEAETWVQDDVTSPCIDAGDPNSPISDEPFPNGGRINMGAYGGTGEASKSLGRIIYVDDDAAEDGTGATWEQAYRDLQSALDVAEAGDEIWVAGGVYRPSKGLLVSESERNASFSLIPGVAIRGGFAGTAGSDPNARDVARFESILSGDLRGDDADSGNQIDNCFHVVTADAADRMTVLDGFAIEGGAADGWNGTDYSGGGLMVYQGTPTVIGCTFRRNTARSEGGAVLLHQSNAVLIDCTFVENTASYAGGAVAVHAGEPVFRGCDFVRNTAARFYYAGAVHISGLSKSEFSGCRFVANLATYGGAVRNVQSTAVFRSCLFTGNRAKYYRFSSVPVSSKKTDSLKSATAGATWGGPPDVLTRRGGDGDAGAIYSSDNSTLILDSCTVVDNYADMYGGILSWGDDLCEMTNCIVWGNVAVYSGVGSQQIRGDIVTARYCCVQDPPDSLRGVGNIADDPAFVRSGRWADPIDPALEGSPSDTAAQWIEGDYHLKSQAGRWDPNSEAWLLDETTSLCIDAGDPDSSVGDEPQPNGGRINMGFYGGTGEASKAYFIIPPLGRVLRVSGDGSTDYSTIQAAIDACADGDVVCVAPGVYTGDGNRDIDFQGKAITVRSDGGPASCIIDCQASQAESHRGFYFHSGETADSILQGFTIKNGWVVRHDRGGAILCEGSGPTILDCIFAENRARLGGALAADNAAVRVIRCVVSDNMAYEDGGGIWCSASWDFTAVSFFEGCLITGNYAVASIRFGGDGGGMMISGANCEIRNCTIAGNRAGYTGGGIAFWYANGVVSNSIVWGNTFPLGHGDEIAVASSKYDVRFGGAEKRITIEHSMIGSRGAEDFSLAADEGGVLTGAWLVGDPCFVRPGYWDPNGTPEDPPFGISDDFWVDGDYHLKSEAGRWDTDSRSWVADDVTSPCIDAGDPNSPIGDEPQPNGGRINMGDYGGTAEASKSYLTAEGGGG